MPILVLRPVSAPYLKPVPFSDADILRAKQKACQDPISLLGGLIPCSRLGYTEERGGESRTRGKDGGERGLKKGI